MPKKYKNVSEIAKTILDKEYSKEVDEYIHSRQLSKLLFSMRCSTGISQEEMAIKLKCTQSKISKIENSINENIKIKDLIDYSSALNLQLGISFASTKRNTVDSIKYHAFKIKDHLDKLAEMAKGDDKISEGISGFFGEYFFNMLNFFQKSYGKLEKNRKPKKEHIHITAPINVHDKSFEDLFQKTKST